MTPRSPSGHKQQALNNTLRLLRENKPNIAEQQLREILSVNPDDIDAMRALGVLFAVQGKFDEAERQLKTTLRKAPGFAAAHCDLGRTYLEIGNLKKAERSFKRAVEHDPKSIDAWKRLVDCLVARGKKQEAAKAYEHVVAAGRVTKMMLEAQELMVRKDFVAARGLYMEILRTDPANSEAYQELALIACRAGAYREAERLLHHSRKQDENNFRAWDLYGNVLIMRHKHDESVEVLKIGLKMHPHDPGLWTTLGLAYSRLLQGVEAIAAMEKALQINPDLPHLMIHMGDLHNTLGDTVAAASFYKRALNFQDAKAQAYWCLSNLKTYNFSDAEVTDMGKLLTEPSKKSGDVVHLNFALASSAEDREDYDTAFQHYAAGNTHHKQLTSYDPERIESETDRMIELFTPEFFQERKDYGHDDPAPIFILGMMRSGSTLLEQILGSHSQVDGTTELFEIREIVDDLKYGDDGNKPENLYPDIVDRLTAQECKALGQQYIEGTKKYRGDAPFFIDKMHANFHHIGLIKLILPNATIIDARRHPMGTCFGCYKKVFGLQDDFTTDFDDLARHFTNYSRLMDHWNDALPGSVLRVQYEDVVDDTKYQVSQMLDHCGLPFEDSCLRFYEANRTVRTPSAEQVRQPIYSDGVDFWQRYEKHLAPLKKALAPVLDDNLSK